MAQAQILVVEDEVLVAESLCETLQHLGYGVAGVAYNGESAICQVELTRPDLVLMDIEFRPGGMDGAQAAQQIHQRWGTPIIFVTAYSDAEILRRAKISEPFGYIIKPIRTRDLQITIEIALYKHRMEQQLRFSEARYRQLVENLHEGIWILDETCHITFANRSMTQILGYSLEEMQGRRFCDFFSHAPEDPCPMREIAPCYADRTRLTFEFRRRNGTPRYAFLSFSELEGAEALGKRIVVVLQDITEQIHTRNALHSSETRFHTLTRMAPVGVYITDTNGSCEYANDLWLKMSGLTMQEARGDGWIKGLHPQDRERIFDAWQRMVESRGQWGLAYRFMTPEGHVTWVWGVATALYAEDEKTIVGYIGANTDITRYIESEQERERLLEQIQAQAQRMQKIIDTVPEGVLLLDKQGQVLVANPQGQAALDWLCDALPAGQPIAHLGEHALTELLVAPPKGLWHEIVWRGRIFESLACPIAPNHTADEWVLVLHDVTEQRASEQQIQQQERLAAVGQLAAGIAHDFNNVMSTIILYAQLAAQSATLATRDRERLDIIDHQARHASELIQQILDFSRQTVFKRQPLNLAPLLKEHVKLLQRTLPENIRVELDLGPTFASGYSNAIFGALIQADPTRIQQVLLNLAVNARDAMPEGGVLRIGLDRLCVANRQETPLPNMPPGNWVQLTVSDTGCGIPPDVLPHIYDPFFTTKAPGRGNGLGLAQVYGIIGAHEGYIDVQSHVQAAGQPGSTSFTIYLPAVESPECDTPQPAIVNLPPGQQESILVIEDDENARQALTDSLILLNYHPIPCANGREALDALGCKQPDEAGDALPPPPAASHIALVLSDLVMPEMGGVALVRYLRQCQQVMPVIMITGHPLNETAQELRALGIVEWLFKPVRLEQLAEALARQLHHAS